MRPSRTIELPLNEDALNQAVGTSYNSTNAYCLVLAGGTVVISYLDPAARALEQPVATRSPYIQAVEFAVQKSLWDLGTGFGF